MPHTPGPWRLDIRTGCYAIYAGPERACLAAAADDAIVYQGGRGEPSNGPGTYPLLTAGQIANARLIAAAPAMLEALEDVEGKLVDFVAGRINWRPDDFLYRVRAAILKAKGGPSTA